MDTETKEMRIFSDENEESLLVQFLQFFEENKYTELIGYNINFDIRFVLAKCMKYRLSATAFYRAFCTDLMMILKSFRKGYDFNEVGTLDQWGRFLLGQGKLATEVSIPMLYKMGRVDEIIEYCENDLRLTFGVWERLHAVIGEVYT